MSGKRAEYSVISAALILAAIIVLYLTLTSPSFTFAQVVYNASSGGGSTTALKININTATEEQLRTLPGIGSVLAERIAKYREKYGNFKNFEELKKVDGIGDFTYKEIVNYVVL